VPLDDFPTIAPAIVQNTVPKPEQALRHLTTNLDVPSSIAEWVQRLGSKPEQLQAESQTGLPTTIDEWVNVLVQSLSQSGLFFESNLAAKLPVPNNDLKRQLMAIVSQPLNKSKDNTEDVVALENLRHDALHALDDLTKLQGAAMVAHRLGGACYSFVVPAPDQQGAWWITLSCDPPKLPLVRERQGKADDDQQSSSDTQTPRWQVRLGGINLPFGDIDIRIDQYQQQSLGVTVVTPDQAQARRLNGHRPELSQSLEQAGLNLSQFEVLDRKEDRVAQAEVAPPSPGQITWISV
jgi:hypothetical protein